MKTTTKKPKTEKVVKKTAPGGAGVKFTEKYGVRLASTYKADPEHLVIPPDGHKFYDPDGNVTHDPIRVKEIDATGECVRIVTAASDPDTGTLYVIAGRGNVYDVREVNRLRKERGDKPMEIGFLRFSGSEQQAIDFIAMENFRRKRPSLVHVAREIVRYKRLGRGWDRIAELLQLDGEDEKALKARIPIAYCIPEVVEEIATKRMSIAKAKKFGGGAWDGSSALGRDEQLALLETERENKAAKSAPKAPHAPRTAPDRSTWVTVASCLANGAANHLKGQDLVIARSIAAYERYTNGDEGALDHLPEILAIIQKALVTVSNPKTEEVTP